MVGYMPGCPGLRCARSGVIRPNKAIKHAVWCDKCFARDGKPAKMSICREPVRRYPVRCRVECAAIRGFDAIIDFNAKA